jgi:hypothetical protein
MQAAIAEQPGARKAASWRAGVFVVVGIIGSAIVLFALVDGWLTLASEQVNEETATLRTPRRP